jgi:hypothetical protein
MRHRLVPRFGSVFEAKGNGDDCAGQLMLNAHGRDDRQITGGG